MDCFYEFCLFRQNETANPDNCDYLACKNRCEGTFAYSADCYILTAKDPVTYDELIPLSKEEQPSFEEELLKLFGGE